MEAHFDQIGGEETQPIDNARIGIAHVGPRNGGVKGGRNRIGSGNVEGPGHLSGVEALHPARYRGGPQNAPGAEGMNANPERTGNPAAGGNLIAGNQGRDQVPTAAPLSLGQGQGSGHGMNGGVAAHEGVSLVHLQCTAGRCVDQGRPIGCRFAVQTHQ